MARVSFAIFLVMMSLMLPYPCGAAWETIGDWKVLEEDSLSIRHGEGAQAWNSDLKPGRSWSVRANVKVRKAANTLFGSAALVFADAQRSPVLVVSLRCRSGKLSQLEVETVTNSKPRTILSSQWIPGGDEAFAIHLLRVGRSLQVVVYGDKYLSYTEKTPETPDKVLDSIAVFGLGAQKADVDFSDIVFQSPAVEPNADEVRAAAAVGDLLAHFWTGGLDQGYIIPTSHGYPAPDLTNARGGIWERATMAFALDTLHRANHDPTIARRLRTEWARLKRLYTAEELEAAGGSLHPASDDAGWDALYYLILYRHTGDRDALERAHGLVSNSFQRWLDTELGGGLWYNNERKQKSLYAVALVSSALTIAEDTHDAAMKDRALGCYRWMESKLLRPDGLYWTDRDGRGPVGEAYPERIGEASSVTFLAGNMGMGVLHARLYRMTNEKLYLDRAVRTAEAMAQKLTTDGVYLDDRDAWTNGALAGDWAEQVLTLPGITDRHKELLLRTADSIYRRARTSQGYYGGSWSGPAEGPGSRWCMGGSRPEQIMTSSSAVNIIAAAALAGRGLSGAD